MRMARNSTVSPAEKTYRYWAMLTLILRQTPTAAAMPMVMSCKCTQRRKFAFPDVSPRHCSGDGYDVTLDASALASPYNISSDHDHDHEEDSADETSGVASDEISCHTHAGVPHCVDAEGNTVEQGCSRPEYDYNVPLRIGLLFVILVGSAIGVFIPVVAERFTRIKTDSVLFIGLRQFGTGVIISTALVHVSVKIGSTYHSMIPDRR